ncbi:UPF0496 protein 1-like [Primulina huaijiensis]|uniref:UPF0496 protein 1-like n=1 Tax=Primulina huaijiensis TaxID=1492673 RepID=UPI003CC72320
MGNQLSLRIGRTSSSRRRPPPRTTTNSNTNAHEMNGNNSSSSRHRPPRTTFNPGFNADEIDRGSSSSGRPPSRSTSDPNSNTDDADLNSYEAACRDDPDLRSFDSTVQLRTARAINSIAVDVEVRALSLDSLRDVTESLLEMNHEVVQIILRNKTDIWKNQELFDLVNDYFENSLLTLDFCTALDSCLKKAGIVESIINIALKKFEEEHYGEYSGEGPVKNYSKTVEELSRFREAGDPFTQEFFKAFNSVYSKQILMLEKLQTKKKKLDKKLKKLKAWKKVSNVIFVSAFVSVLICSVVAAAVTAPPVVVALAAAAAVPLGSMGKWLNSIWKNCEKDLMRQRELISSMQIGSYIIIKDLDSIRILVEKFRIKIESLLGNAEFAVREDDEVVVIAMKEIRKEVDGFIKTIHDLSHHANKCTQETRMARTLILRRIINHPGSTDQDIGTFS